MVATYLLCDTRHMIRGPRPAALELAWGWSFGARQERRHHEDTRAFIHAIMDRSDYVRIIDAAHDYAASDEAWLRGLVGALRPVLDRGLGVFAWFHAPHELPAAPLVTNLGAPAAAVERLWDPLRAAMSVGPVTTLRATLGAEALGHLLGGAAIEHRIADALGLFCLDIDGHGLGIAAYSPEVVELSRQERHVFERVVVHLTAAFRLRRRRIVTEAMVSPSGTIAHAERPGRSPPTRESLRAAAVAHDEALAHEEARARGPDAVDVLGLHRALVAGQWRLVDTFESDGKRYLIARHNAPAPALEPELSVRETQVAVLAAMGHALKMIAYELGISESSVATYLRRALVKLRLPDRNALTRRFAGFRHSE